MSAVRHMSSTESSSKVFSSRRGTIFSIISRRLAACFSSTLVIASSSDRNGARTFPRFLESILKYISHFVKVFQQKIIDIREKEYRIKIESILIFH